MLICLFIFGSFSTEPYRKRCSELKDTDDNETKSNCWDCNPSCSEFAECVYPGKCECQYNLDGNGIDGCYSPTPIIQNYTLSPLQENQLLFITVNYELTNQYTPINGYCVINNQILSGFLNYNDSITCMIPKSIFGISLLKISFDQQHWSSEIHLTLPHSKRLLPNPTPKLHDPVYIEYNNNYQIPLYKNPWFVLIIYSFVFSCAYIFDKFRLAQKRPAALLPVSKFR